MKKDKNNATTWTAEDFDVRSFDETIDEEALRDINGGHTEQPTAGGPGGLVVLIPSK